MKATFSLVNVFNCFFYRRQRMDIVVHIKMVFDCKNCFWKLNCIIFCATVQHKNCTKREQVASKTNLVNRYWLTISSLGQRKRSSDCSSCLIAICMSMPSISERMETGFSQNWVSFATLRNFLGLFGLTTG